MHDRTSRLVTAGVAGVAWLAVAGGSSAAASSSGVDAPPASDVTVDQDIGEDQGDSAMITTRAGLLASSPTASIIDGDELPGLVAHVDVELLGN